MIDINKKYRTRDGREVRIYATDGPNTQNIHGAVKDSDGWTLSAWYIDGVYTRAERKGGPRDLIEVSPRHKRTVWVNVYGNHVYGTDDRFGADAVANKINRIACIKVELDFEEGEGL